jgi:ubiquinone/menaquinone biosynthesis C-methylase UbiE
MTGPQRPAERDEAERIRRVYADRSARGLDARYTAHRAEVLLGLHQAERLLLTGLGAHGWTDFRRLQVLDVGCGSGGTLLRLISHDLDPTRVHGIDIREDVISRARSRIPSADLRVGNATDLPYADNSMDLVLQFTMISSVLDARQRARVAAEMSRIVSPRGLIVSYDFRLNPLNPDTRGLSRRELRALFPRHRVDARSVTLAPPIARFVAPRSYGIATALQALAPLRSHLLAFISPPDQPPPA